MAEGADGSVGSGPVETAGACKEEVEAWVRRSCQSWLILARASALRRSTEEGSGGGGGVGSGVEGLGREQRSRESGRRSI